MCPMACSAAIVVAALIPDLGKIEPGAIAHAHRYVRGQQPLEAHARLVVHTEFQVQAARQQVRVMRVMRHPLPLVEGFELGEGLELLT